MLPSRQFKMILRGIMGVLKSGETPSSSSSRSFTTTLPLLANYYEALGLPASATQADIKAAYYKLSMLYHPDKNKDNEVAVEKFRKITEAYEVLGNFRLRRLYDKGIIHTAGSQYSHMRPRYADEETPTPEPDDAQTKFYKAHMKKSKVPHVSGRTPIYDFDEWSRAHYGASFERRKAAKEKHTKQTESKYTDGKALENEFLLYGLSFFVVCFLMVFINERCVDEVQERIAPPTLEVVSNTSNNSEFDKKTA